MLRVSAAFGGRGLLRSLPAVLVCALLCACSSVSGVEIQRIAQNPPKVNTFFVRYMDVGMVQERVTGWAYGPRGTTVAPSPASVKPGADRNTDTFNKLLAANFKDRFPEIARAYGVTVSPTSSTILLVQLANTLPVDSPVDGTLDMAIADRHQRHPADVWRHDIDHGGQRRQGGSEPGHGG